MLLDISPTPDYDCEIFHRDCMVDLSEPVKERLLQLLNLLEKNVRSKVITSTTIEQLTGWPRETIRKDISCLRMEAAANLTENYTIGGNSGYEPELLIPLIKKALELDRCRKFCVVGLGWLGSAYLNLTPLELTGFELAAGFDSNVNRVEILKSPAPLYPAYKMAEVISRFSIEIALLCVPAETAQSAAEKCVAAGIRGILNFAPAALNLPQKIVVRNVYVTNELQSLAIRIKDF